MGLLLLCVAIAVGFALAWAHRARVESERLAREARELHGAVDALRAQVARLREAVRSLAGEEASGTAAPRAPAARVPVPAPPPARAASPPLPPPSPPPPPSAGPALPPIAPASTLTLEQRIGARWTTLLGAIVLLLATGFFLRWSFQRELIGPTGRVVLGLAAGVGMLAGGVALRRRRDLAYLAVGVSGFGLGALYLSLYAAHARYGLLGPAAAFGAMTLVTLAGAAVSVWSRLQGTAVLAVLGGLLTPILVSTDHPDERVLLAYLIALDLLALSVSRFRDWAGLNRLAWVGSVLLLVPLFLSSPAAPHPVARLALLSALFAVFLAVPLLRAWSERRPVGRLDLTLVLSNAAAYGSGTYLTLEHWRPGLEGPWAWLLAAVYVLVGARFRQRVPQDEPTETAHLGAAATLFASGFPLVFDGPWVTLAWAVQGVALVVLATRTRSLAAIAGGPILLGLAVARAAWLDRAWYPAEVPLANVGFAVHVLVVAALGVAGTLAPRVRAEADDPLILRRLFWGLGTALATLLLWREPPWPWPEPLLAALAVGLVLLWRRGERDAVLLAGAGLAALAAVAQVLRAWAGPEPRPPLLDPPLLAHLAVVAALALSGAWCGASARVRSFARSSFWMAAILLLAAVLWIEPSGVAPAFLLLAELVLVAALARVEPDRALVAGALVLGGTVLLRVLLADAAEAHRAARALWNVWLLVRVAACAALALAGLLVRPRAPRQAGVALQAAAASALLCVLSLGWAEHQGWRARDAFAAGDAAGAQHARWLGQVGLSVLWTLYAAALLAFGFVRATAPVRYAGLGLLGLVFLKVMVVDLSRLDAIYRILSFAVLGLVLFGVAFFYQRASATRRTA